MLSVFEKSKNSIDIETTSQLSSSRESLKTDERSDVDENPLNEPVKSPTKQTAEKSVYNQRKSKIRPFLRNTKSYMIFSTPNKLQKKQFSLEWINSGPTQSPRLYDFAPSKQEDVVKVQCQKLNLTIDDVTHNLQHEQELLCERKSD